MKTRVTPLCGRHQLGKGISESVDRLEQRQIGVAEFRSGKAAARVFRKQALEIAEIFRQAARTEIRRTTTRFRLLVVVVKAGRDRMMRVVDLDQEVEQRQLTLMDPEPSGLVLGRQSMPSAEIKQDRRRLGDEQRASFEKGRRERRAR